MNVGAAIREILLADAAVAALVGDRVRPVAMHEADEDAESVVYHPISDVRLRSHDGPTGGAGEARYQLAMRAPTFDRLEALRVAAIGRLDCYGGEHQGAIVRLFFDDAADQTAFVEDGEGRPLYRQDADFVVLYEPAA